MGKCAIPLIEAMLSETRRIEKNLVSKLNCMYFAARKVSLPSIEFMLKKEDELEQAEKGSTLKLYTDFSQKLNGLINHYFQAARGGKKLKIFFILTLLTIFRGH